MKKMVCSALLAAVILLLPVKAEIMKQGDMRFNAGLGLFSGLYSGSYYSTSIPPIALSFDKGIKDDIGPGNIAIGGYLGFSKFKYEAYDWWYGGTYGWEYTTFILGGRATYHMDFDIENVDTYGGLMLYFINYSVRDFGIATSYTSSLGSGLSLDAMVGGRYNFTDKLSVFSEIGYGIAYWTIGVSVNM